MILFVCDVEELRPIIDVARLQPGVSLRPHGPYVALESDARVVIDRRATGTRHAVWYSSVAGVTGGRVVQFDADALVIEPA